MSETINDREIRDSEATVKGVELFSDMVNNMCFSEKAFGEWAGNAFVRQHRTLQQNMIKALVGVIRYLAQQYDERGDGASFDLRNEASVKWIKEVAKLDAYFPHV